jgi:hypothetical protein
MFCRLLRLTVLLPLLGTGSLTAAPGDKAAEEPALTAKDLPAIWKEFGRIDDDARVQVLQDIGRLAKVPALAVPFLKERLQPVAGPNAKTIESMIADLDSNEFEKREKASKDLEGLGVLAGPILERKLAEKKLPPDAQNRLEELVERLEEANRRLSAEALRGVRGVEVLLQAGTPEAKSLLETLAKGADGARLTIDARKALAFWPTGSR